MSINAVPDGPPAGNGGPPSNFELDRRLTVLETRFDMILPTLVTKQDLQEFRVELHKLHSDAMKWIIGLALTTFVGTLAVNFSMWKEIRGIERALHDVERDASLRASPQPLK
jgi:hypothetical protein